MPELGIARTFGLFVALVSQLAILYGCATSRLYPVCFYSAPPPTQEDIEKRYKPVLKEVFFQNLNWANDRPVIFTADGRWVVARTTDSENSQLSILWPRVACIGEAGLDKVILEKFCVEYVRDFIKDQNYLEFGTYEVKQKLKDFDAEPGIRIPNESPNPNRLVLCRGRV